MTMDIPQIKKAVVLLTANFDGRVLIYVYIYIYRERERERETERVV